MKQKEIKPKAIFFRPTEYDMSVIELVRERNPHLTSMADIFRAALRLAELHIEKEKEKK